MERRVEVSDGELLFEQVTDVETRRLYYDYKKCVGCGICVYACPVSAVELQPVHDIALGVDMPPVMIDHTKCVYCGICFSLCPLNAFRFELDGFSVEKSMTPVWLAGKISKTDKCVNCSICQKVCPTGAVERVVKLRREDIPLRNEGVKGYVKVDEEKCTLCGKCVEFCSAFVAVEGEGLKPFEKILFDESKCDYCELCMDVCPSDAIEVKGMRVVEERLEDVAEVSIDEGKCIYCGRCLKACPYEGVEVEKPIFGKLVVYEHLLRLKCDPTGCKACVNICPTGAWEIREGFPTVDEDICIYCGACENACHLGLIRVVRINLRVERNETPWTSGWLKAVERVVKRRRAEVFVAEREVREEVKMEVKVGKPEVSERLLKIVECLEEKLRKPAFRKNLEL